VLNFFRICGGVAVSIVSTRVKLYDSLITIVFIFLALERIYMSAGVTSGTYNNYITFILFGTSTLIMLLKRNGLVGTPKVLLSGTFFLVYLLINYITFQVSFTETFRYVGDFMLMYVGYELRFTLLKPVVYIQTTLGLIFTFVVSNTVDGGRTTGFLSTSPTNFGFLLMIGIAIIIFSDKMTKFDFLVILFSLLLIYRTYSRSIIFGALGVIAIRVLIMSWNSRKVGHLKTGIIFLILACILYLVFPAISNIRADGGDSDNTRVFLIQGLWNRLLEIPVHIITGFGGGSSYSYTSSLVGRVLPPHFDLLVWIFDLGIVGGTLFMAAILALTRDHFKIICVYLLVVGTVHNLLFFPQALFLIFLFWGGEDNGKHVFRYHEQVD